MYKTAYLTALIILLKLANTLYAQKATSLELYFKSDSFNLAHDEYLRLNSFFKNLDTVVITGISVLGYCDDTGEAEYNEVLSAKRAKHIKDLLKEVINVELGVYILGKGEIALSEKDPKPIALQRSQNRRVDITVNYELLKKVISTTVSDNLLSDNQKVGDKVSFETILFIGGRHILLPESIPTLRSLAETLKSKKQYHIKILGHICCMEFGKDGVDYDTGLTNLSEARAKAIYDYLVNNSIGTERLEYKGLKSDFPTGREAKYDRRVEFEITKIDK